MLQALAIAAGADRRAVCRSPRTSRPASSASSSEGWRPTCCSSPAASPPASATSSPAPSSSWASTRVFHKVRLKPGKPLWFGVGPRRGEPARAAGLRPARQPGQRPGRVPALRPAGARASWRAGPGAAPEPRSRGWRPRVRPPRRPAHLSSRAVGRGRPTPRRRGVIEPLTGPARPTCWAWPGPTASPSSRPATGFSSAGEIVAFPAARLDEAAAHASCGST